MSVTIVQPEVGERLEAFGDIVFVKLDSEATGGKFDLVEARTPEGVGTPLHRHSAGDETFMIVEGRLRFTVEGDQLTLGPGGVVHIPAGVTHSFKNVGDSPTRHYVQTEPAHFVDFFRAVSLEWAKGPKPDMARILKICEKFGIEILGPPPD